jgi:hypothetical protein
MRSSVIAALLLAPVALFAQVTTMTPRMPVQGEGMASENHYGPPRVVDLDAILMGDGLQRTHVITEGKVVPLQLNRYWTLRAGTEAVLLIPARGFDPTQFEEASRSDRMEVRGIVRFIRKKEYINGIDLDLIEDPLLPPMPPPMTDQGGPRLSITVFAMRDRAEAETAKRPEPAGFARRILDEPSAYSGKNARIYGQFRGRNLFGDLPPGSVRGKDDWVLKDGDTAMWVTGKTPKGDGWKLDLDYKGDSKNWLEVEGKPEVVNGVVFLKASKVLMAKPPGKVKPEPQGR